MLPRVCSSATLPRWPFPQVCDSFTALRPIPAHGVAVLALGCGKGRIRGHRFASNPLC